MAEPLKIRIGFVGKVREKLLRVRDRVRPAVFREFNAFIQDIFNVSQRRVSGNDLQVRTGHLRRSGYWETKETSSGFEGTVGYRASYAKAQDQGTKPFVIRPKKKKALRFLGSDGAPVFAKAVRHPGLRPRLFLSGTFVAHKPLLKPRLTKVILQTINES